MVRSGVRSLPIAGDGGEIVGLLADDDLLVAHGSSPLEYLRDIAQTRLRKDLAEKRARLPRLVRALMLEGARVDSLTWLISAVSDATLRRVLDMALADMGPPPVPFVFLTLGSEGRREQTLVTDQDNAIVFADVPGREEAAAEYFPRLGERVCTWLKEVGVEYCDGDVMASNGEWCQPLSVWKEYFRKWVRVPVPEAVLNSSIFFDFREVHGDVALAAELRGHVTQLLASRPGMFFNLLAQAVVDKELPVGLFGRISVETRGSREDVFDIKQPIARICELTRLQGLWHGIGATSTLERLRKLSQQAEVDARVCLDLKHAYSFLMQLRLARQVAALGDGGVPADNLISTQRDLHPRAALPRGSLRAHRTSAGERAQDVRARRERAHGREHPASVRCSGSSGERPRARPRRCAEAHLKTIDAVEWREPIRTQTLRARLRDDRARPRARRDPLDRRGPHSRRPDRDAGALLPGVQADRGGLAEGGHPHPRARPRGGQPRRAARRRARRLLDFLGDACVMGHFTTSIWASSTRRSVEDAAALKTPRSTPASCTAGGAGRDAPPGQAPDRREPRGRSSSSWGCRATRRTTRSTTRSRTGMVFLKLLGDFEASGAVQFRALYREAGVY